MASVARRADDSGPDTGGTQRVVRGTAQLTGARGRDRPRLPGQPLIRAAADTSGGIRPRTDFSVRPSSVKDDKVCVFLNFAPELKFCKPVYVRILNF